MTFDFGGSALCTCSTRWQGQYIEARQAKWNNYWPTTLPRRDYAAADETTLAAVTTQANNNNTKYKWQHNCAWTILRTTTKTQSFSVRTDVSQRRRPNLNCAQLFVALVDVGQREWQKLGVVWTNKTLNGLERKKKRKCQAERNVTKKRYEGAKITNRTWVRMKAFRRNAGIYCPSSIYTWHIQTDTSEI